METLEILFICAAVFFNGLILMAIAYNRGFEDGRNQVLNEWISFDVGTKPASGTETSRIVMERCPICYDGTLNEGTCPNCFWSEDDVIYRNVPLPPEIHEDIQTLIKIALSDTTAWEHGSTWVLYDEEITAIANRRASMERVQAWLDSQK